MEITYIQGDKKTILVSSFSENNRLAASGNLMKIEGRSGCRIEIFEKGDRLFVRKFASTVSYNQRLERQKNKQCLFPGPELRDLSFFTPTVYDEGIDHGIYWFDMDFISGEKYSSWLIKLNKKQLDHFITEIIQYFNKSILHASLVEAPHDIIQEKLHQLMASLMNTNGLDSGLVKKVIAYLSNIPIGKLYVGTCHGDFTLSNMLFLKNEQICVFDLLDSFIESPVIDYVKIRQDTFYKWTMHIENENNQYSTKLIQVLDYIDKMLLQTFKEDRVIHVWEHYLTIFNLARILPYSKDQKDIRFLQNHLNCLLP